MKLFVVGGFANEGVLKLVQHLMKRAQEHSPGESVVCILCEAAEVDLSIEELDSDTIQIMELKGGCPCCALAGSLEQLFRSSSLSGAEHVVMEVPGTCDIQHLLGNVIGCAPGLDAMVLQVLESSTVRPLLEIVPVLKANLEQCDALVISGDHIQDAVLALEDADVALVASPSQALDAGQARFVMFQRDPSAVQRI